VIPREREREREREMGKKKTGAEPRWNRRPRMTFGMLLSGLESKATTSLRTPIACALTSFS
jgi:hypothetical protein